MSRDTWNMYVFGVLSLQMTLRPTLKTAQEKLQAMANHGIT